MNYLATEHTIVEALEQLSQLRKVYITSNMEDLIERTQTSPCAHVLFGGDSIPEGAQGGKVTKVKQTWLVVLCMRLGKDSSQTGELLDAILKKLMGKKADGCSPLLRINPPLRPSYSKSFGYYPVAFTTTFTHKGDTQ